MLYTKGKSISVGDNNNNSSDENMYKDKEKMLILILSLELYSKLNTISVNTSGPFSSLTSLLDMVHIKRKKPVGLA